MNKWSQLGKIALGLAFTVGVGAIVVGCRQGEGDRCQVDDDCMSPLVCNRATLSCARSNGLGLDAINLDGPIDTPMPDAMIDAPDAM